MSLRSKIILILCGVVALYAAFDNGMLRLVAGDWFDQWEQEGATADLGAIEATLESETEQVITLCRTWAGLDATKKFFQESEDGYFERYLDEGLLERAAVDLLFLCSGTGEVRWSRIRDPVTKKDIGLRSFPTEFISGSNPLVGLPAPIAGLIMTDRGPMLASAQAVGNAHSDVPMGRETPRVIMGRFLDGPLKDKIRSLTATDFDLWSLQRETVPQREQELFDEITASVEMVSDVGEDNRLHLYRTLNDMRLQPTILLRANIDRSISDRGRQAVDYALISTLATAFVILFVLLRLLQRTVIRPLSQLTDFAVEVGKTDDTSLRISIDRDDEIGLLSGEFESMLEKLERSRAETVKTARLAGMSEIATGVLHNVGNVLNSVNVSANMVSKQAEQLSVDDLSMLVDVLAQNEENLAEFVTNDPRGKHLMPFMRELSTSISTQKKSLVTEVFSLREGIDHIAELVRAQQSYAGSTGVFEKSDLAKEMDNAIRICSQAFGGTFDVEIVREYEDLPRIPIDKHKTMEILINLIQNARDAILESGSDEQRITLRLQATDSGMARIEVQDTGMGIEAEDLERIFHHGFTTKDDGHGFGLHVSANAATEMKASLRATSDGPGRGATFVLEIPMTREEAAAAAA